MMLIVVCIVFNEYSVVKGAPVDRHRDVNANIKARIRMPGLPAYWHIVPAIEVYNTLVKKAVTLLASRDSYPRQKWSASSIISYSFK